MIERLFIDNFRCFVNFEWKPGKLALLLGENGSGKTSVIDVLWGVQALVTLGEDVRSVFPATTRTQWDTRWSQRVELSVRIGEERYTYELVIEHSPEDASQTHVKRESLRADDVQLMGFTDGLLQLFNDDGSSGPALPAYGDRSGLGPIAPHKNNKKLMAFKQWLGEGVACFKPDPRAMSSRTDEPVNFFEGRRLLRNLQNFASWYPSFITHDLEAAFRAKKALEEALPGFEMIVVDKIRPYLQARFSAGQGMPYSVDFGSLSDGQRALIALYVLRHAVVQPGRLIVFDEPDNYVALREIQPWLMEIMDAALAPGGPQVWFVSHHPELLNSLAPAHGTRFFRHDGGPVRIEPFKEHPGLTPSEAVARGWVGE
ncbi:MAG TPA: AAA family ATPase [Myxococcaceae bacterium]|jgi:predicted ATPase